MKLVKYIFAICVICAVSSCVKSNSDKRAFIEKKQVQTNKKIAKKHGELIIPEFIQNYDYQFDN